MIDWQLDDASPLIQGYRHLHIPVDDVDDENLLAWFPESNRFIDEGLSSPKKQQVGQQRRHDDLDPADERGGVLVHW